MTSDMPSASADPAGPGPQLRRTYSPEEVANVAGVGLDEVEFLIKTGRLRAVRLADGQARILQSAVVRLDVLRNLADEHPDVVDTVWQVPGDLVADPALLAARLATVPPGGFGVSP